MRPKPSLDHTPLDLYEFIKRADHRPPLPANNYLTQRFLAPFHKTLFLAHIL